LFRYYNHYYYNLKLLLLQLLLLLLWNNNYYDTILYVILLKLLLFEKSEGKIIHQTKLTQNRVSTCNFFVSKHPICRYLIIKFKFSFVTRLSVYICDYPSFFLLTSAISHQTIEIMFPNLTPRHFYLLFKSRQHSINNRS